MSVQDGPNWARIRAELAVLDLFLEHAVTRKSSDPRKRSLNPFQGVILEASDALSSLAQDSTPVAVDIAVQKKVRTLENQITAEPAGSSRLGYLSATLGLQRFEERCLVLALAPELYSRYSEIYAYLQDNVIRTRPTIDLALQLFSTHPDDRMAFTAGAPLMRSRLLLEHEPGGSPLPMSQRALSIDDRVLGFLLESLETDLEIERWVNLVPIPKEAPRVPIRQDIVEKTATMARRCFAGGEANYRPIFHLLGRDGTGRRALAEAACHAAGMPLLAADMRLAGRARDKAESMWRLGRESLLQSAGVLIQHFDDLLEDDADSALSALFETIYHFAIPIVFLCGTREWHPPVHSPATLFISVPCPSPTAEERAGLWAYHLGATDQLPAEDLGLLAAIFNFTDGQIQQAVASARSMAFWDDGANSELTVDNLRRACRKEALPNLGNLARRTERTHNWNSIKLPEPQLNQLREIAAHLKHSTKVLGTWGFAREFQYGLGLAACFEGVSGTGKTMAAGILAAELGQELITTDLSAIQSKYIGETNKHLKLLFDEAQSASAILFIDEADALFGKRSEVKDSHDRYANSEIAFLLQQIEEYRGTVILATNMKQNMDEAFLRRLRFVIHFPFPDEELRLAIWKDIFPKESPIDPSVNIGWLARRLKITGGNIKNIAIRAAFLAADRPRLNMRVIDMDCIVEAAKREYDKLGLTYLPAEFDGWRAALEKIA